jgi:hypothetical protein
MKQVKNGEKSDIGADVRHTKRKRRKNSKKENQNIEKRLKDKEKEIKDEHNKELITFVIENCYKGLQITRILLEVLEKLKLI